MGRACTICAHSNRAEIDSLIAEAIPYLRIATEYGLNDKTLGTHAKNHVKPFIAEVEKQAQAAVLAKIMKYRDEVNLPLPEKTRYIENKLWGDYDTAETIPERMMVMREINKQQGEAAKLTGAYQQDRANEHDATLRREVEANAQVRAMECVCGGYDAQWLAQIDFTYNGRNELMEACVCNSYEAKYPNWTVKDELAWLSQRPVLAARYKPILASGVH